MTPARPRLLPGADVRSEGVDGDQRDVEFLAEGLTIVQTHHGPVAVVDELTDDTDWRETAQLAQVDSSLCVAPALQHAAVDGP